MNFRPYGALAYVDRVLFYRDIIVKNSVGLRSLKQTSLDRNTAKSLGRGQRCLARVEDWLGHILCKGRRQLSPLITLRLPNSSRTFVEWKIL